MSGLTTYLPTTVIEMVAHPDGMWVRLEDVEQLEAELAELQAAKDKMYSAMVKASIRCDELQEKARAAVNAPYEDILDMGLAQALRELKEVL